MNTLWAMMNDPARATLWAALQDFRLVISAILIGWYLVETYRMRKAAQEQISTSQELSKVVPKLPNEVTLDMNLSAGEIRYVLTSRFAGLICCVVRDRL